MCALCLLFAGAAVLCTAGSVSAGTCFFDNDGDGFGDPNNSTECIAECSICGPNLVSDNTDCDDTDPTVHPGAVELCDGLDNDCDGFVDEDAGTTWYADADGDGYGNPTSFMNACSQPAGYVADNTDCDDFDATVNPGAAEVCDGVDNDCNGTVDDGVGSVWYADADGDGYGNPTSLVNACSQPAGYVADNTDCDDTDAGINPGATEIPGDGIDQNCDGFDSGSCCDVVGDANGDGTVNVADAVHLINYIFKGGPGPVCP